MKNQPNHTLFLAAAALALTTGPALAQITNLHANALLSGYVRIDTPTETVEDLQGNTYPDLPPIWDIFLTPLAVSTDDALTYSRCSLYQSLGVGPNLIQSVSTLDPSIVIGLADTTGAARSESRQTFTFDLETPHTCSYSGSLLAAANASTWITLKENAPPFIPVFSYLAENETVDFGPASIVLPAGSYKFDACTLSDIQTGDFLESPSSWLVDFTIVPAPTPCPGDANADNVVNFTDITSILANFGATYQTNTKPGDANHDGVVNFADVTETLAHFNDVCG